MKIRKKKFPMNHPGYLTWEGGLLMQQCNAIPAGVLPDSVVTVAWLPAIIAVKAVLLLDIAVKGVFLREIAWQEEQNSTQLFFRTK